MQLAALGTTLSAVEEDDTGERIRERRARLGWSVKELAERAGLDRDTVASVEAGGNARIQTVHAIRRALSEAETDPSSSVRPIGDPEDGLVEFTVEGHFGVRAVVKGPIKDIDKLQAAVAKLMAGMDRPTPRDEISD